MPNKKYQKFEDYEDTRPNIKKVFDMVVEYAKAERHLTALKIKNINDTDYQDYFFAKTFNRMKHMLSIINTKDRYISRIKYLNIVIKNDAEIFEKYDKKLIISRKKYKLLSAISRFKNRIYDYHDPELDDMDNHFKDIIFAFEQYDKKFKKSLKIIRKDTKVYLDGNFTYDEHFEMWGLYPDIHGCDFRLYEKEFELDDSCEDAECD